MTMTRDTKKAIKKEIKSAKAGRGLEIMGLSTREARIAAVGHPFGDLAYTMANQAAMGRRKGRRTAETARELAVQKMQGRRR